MTAGRPTVMTPKIIAKLEEAFSWGCSDIEACLYAGITKTPFYAYQDKHPEFKERKEALKKCTTMHAKKNMHHSILKGDTTDSKWWLEKKEPDEFNGKNTTKLEGGITLSVDKDDASL